MDGTLTGKHACLGWWAASPGVGAPWAGGLWAVDATAAAPCPPSPPAADPERVAGSGMVCLAWGAEGEVGWPGKLAFRAWSFRWCAVFLSLGWAVGRRWGLARDILAWHGAGRSTGRFGCCILPGDVL